MDHGAREPGADEEAQRYWLFWCRDDSGGPFGIILGTGESLPDYPGFRAGSGEGPFATRLDAETALAFGRGWPGKA